MNMPETEMSDTNPDYIVLDEFHRCGAKQWGNGSNKFLNLHKTASVLGLTATDIRYLDGQRNMSSELFDGNIASYMTLGEAVVREILNPPKYVWRYFHIKKSLKKQKTELNRQKKSLSETGAKDTLNSSEKFCKMPTEQKSSLKRT